MDNKSLIFEYMDKFDGTIQNMSPDGIQVYEIDGKLYNADIDDFDAILKEGISEGKDTLLEAVKQKELKYPDDALI